MPSADPFELSTGNRQVARALRADGDEQGVVVVAKLIPDDVLTHIFAGLKTNSFSLEDVDTPVDDPLFELEVGDAVAQQPAQLVSAFVDDHLVSSSVELRCGGESGRTRAYDCDAAPRSLSWRLRYDPTFLEGSLDNLLFDLLDRHRLVVDGQDTSRFAGCRAESAGELGEVVRGVESFDGGSPLVSINELVPFGNHVSEWTSLSTERDATVHTTATLFFLLVARPVEIELIVVAKSLFESSFRGVTLIPLDEAGVFSHSCCLSLFRRW